MRSWFLPAPRILPWGALLLLGGAAPSPEVQFTDVTQAVGIDFKHESSATSNKYLVETMGGGVALLDYDNDGRLDVFFTNGAKIEDPMPAGKHPDKSDPRFWNRLYRQNPDGTFSDVTERAGLTGMPQNRYGMGGIGRAACRGRAQIPAVARSLKKKKHTPTPTTHTPHPPPPPTP